MSIDGFTEFISVGKYTPRSQLDVNGGLRANKGPGLLNTDNVGYAFEGDGNTGLFATGGTATNGSSLYLQIDGIPRSVPCHTPSLSLSFSFSFCCPLFSLRFSQTLSHLHFLYLSSSVFSLYLFATLCSFSVAPSSRVFGIHFSIFCHITASPCLSPIIYPLC